MSKEPRDSGKHARGGNAGKTPPGRKFGFGSGRDQKGPDKQPRGKDKPGGRDK